MFKVKFSFDYYGCEGLATASRNGINLFVSEKPAKDAPFDALLDGASKSVFFSWDSLPGGEADLNEFIFEKGVGIAREIASI